MTEPLKFDFKSALVTGGAGFIGSHLVDALVEADCRVSVIDNLSTGKIENLSHLDGQFTFCEGDIRDRDLVTETAAGCEAIFHQAAVVSVPQTVEDPIGSSEVNRLGTLTVLEAARKTGALRVILAGSCAVYGDDPKLPKDEETPPHPKSPYAVQKLTNELDARLYHDLYGVQTTCLRYFNVFGPRQDPSSPYSGVISIFMTRAGAGRQPVIYGDGNQFRDFIFVGDVVRANLLAAASPRSGGKVFNIGTGNSVRIIELWEKIRTMAGASTSPEYRPERIGDIAASVADISRAISVLGFEPATSFTDGLKTTFEWYKKNPPATASPLPGRL